MPLTKYKVKQLLKRVPGIEIIYSLYMTIRSLLWSFRNPLNPFLRDAHPGHFYSPIPDINYIRSQRNNIFITNKLSCTGIEMDPDKQLSLVEKFESYYGQFPFPENERKGIRYYLKNPYFGHGSSIVLYSVLRHFKPRQIVEVGSGFSSAVMLDVNDLFFSGGIKLSFIEPYPARLYSLMNEKDKASHDIFVDVVQNVPRSAFSELNENDLLFIDSSHVAKVGSDVVLLITEILPLLKKGVIIHIHDIYWPFEYPENWVLSGKAWNEAYLVKAFLQFNTSFEILLFNSYLTLHHREHMKKYLPSFIPDGGGSLWIRKIA